MAIGLMGWHDVRKINYIENVGLLVNGFTNKWINIFDKSGKLTREIPLPDASLFYPVMDANNNIYKLSTGSGAIQLLDSESKIIDSLINDKELRRSFEFTPFIPRWIEHMSAPSHDRVFYDLLSDNRFIVYLARSSTIYIFKDRKLTDQYPVIPKTALIERQIRLNRLNEAENTKEWQALLKKHPEIKNRTLNFVVLLREMFVDRDTLSHYYLASFEPVNGHQNMIYKFSTSGELLEALYFNPPHGKKEYVFFRHKFNRLFYGIGENHIYICKR
jgi:hypothetical protein